MSDRLTIWNVALGRISEGQTVDDPDEDTVPRVPAGATTTSPGTRCCPPHSWGFAKRIIQPRPDSDPDPTGWAYIYAYPSDASPSGGSGSCARPSAGAINPTWRSSPAPSTWLGPRCRMSPGSSLGSRARARRHDRHRFPTCQTPMSNTTAGSRTRPSFRPCSPTRSPGALAVDLAMVVARSDAMRQTAWNGFNVVMAQAAADSARQRHDQRPDSELIRARGLTVGPARSVQLCRRRARPALARPRRPSGVRQQRQPCPQLLRQEVRRPRQPCGAPAGARDGVPALAGCPSRSARRRATS